VVICLERGADLHMAQLVPLPLIVSCFSKIQIGFTFLVPAHPGSPGQRAVKRVCVCVYVFVGRRAIAARTNKAQKWAIVARYSVFSYDVKLPTFNWRRRFPRASSWSSVVGAGE